MKSIKFTMLIKKMEGFNESEMLNIIENNLSELNEVTSVRYGLIEGGYRFEIDFEPRLSEVAYQPIFGCFTGIELEYDKVKLVGIPRDQIEYC